MFLYPRPHYCSKRILCTITYTRTHQRKGILHKMKYILHREHAAAAAAASTHIISALTLTCAHDVVPHDRPKQSH